MTTVIKISYKEGTLWSNHALRVVLGWILWVGTHIVINDPLPDGNWQF